MSEKSSKSMVHKRVFARFRTFFVDITEKACKKRGFRHGDRALDPKGRKVTMMGVAPMYSGTREPKVEDYVMWYLLDGEKYVCMWNRGNLRNYGFKPLP